MAGDRLVPSDSLRMPSTMRRGRRSGWLSAAFVVGCAALPLPELAPNQIEYWVETDWEGAHLEEGVRVFTTDLGYVVGLESFWFRTTSVELVPCEDTLEEELEEEQEHGQANDAISQGLRTVITSLLPGRAYAHGSAYDHDISVSEPEDFDELLSEELHLRGQSIALRARYCELFSVHGTGRDQTVASLRGWYQLPGSDERIPFEAEHPLGVTDVRPLPVGAWNDALLPFASEVIVTRHPARAFDGLELETLPPVDLAYEVSLGLLRSRSLHWSIGPAEE